MVIKLATTTIVAWFFAIAAFAQPARAFDGPMVLALSWQPAFCERRSHLPECTSQRPGRFDASNLVLHGLWPGPRGVEYCSISKKLERLDRDRQWKRLPPLGLPSGLQSRLIESMPGAQSGLHRHEWIKHGACYGGGPERYYRHSIAMLDAVNASSLGELLRRSIGQRVTLRAIQDAIERDFGPGAGERVSLKCSRDGGRVLIGEVRLMLGGPYGSLGAMLARARPAKRGCRGGIVDPVGLQ